MKLVMFLAALLGFQGLHAHRERDLLEQFRSDVCDGKLDVDGITRVLMPLTSGESTKLGDSLRLWVLGASTVDVAFARGEDVWLATAYDEARTFDVTVAVPRLSLASLLRGEATCAVTTEPWSLVAARRLALANGTSGVLIARRGKG